MGRKLTVRAVNKVNVCNRENMSYIIDTGSMMTRRGMKLASRTKWLMLKVNILFI